MYVGRIVAAGMTKGGRPCAMYRVSSRSFPNREAVVDDNRIAVVPRAGFETDLKKSPYISYNCLHIVKDFAVATNGSHTDPIAEKIFMGVPPRDAMASVLLAMDYEKDGYSTPRIAAVVGLKSSHAYLGVVRKDGLCVRELELAPGRVHYLATYEKNSPCGDHREEGFRADSALEACSHILHGGVFANFEKPVTAAAALAADGGFVLASSSI